MEGSEAIARWVCHSQSTAVALVSSGQLRDANERFQKLDGAGEPWRWLAGPHGKVRYGSLSELIRAEAATLAPVPTSPASSGRGR